MAGAIDRGTEDGIGRMQGVDDGGCVCGALISGRQVVSMLTWLTWRICAEGGPNAKWRCVARRKPWHTAPSRMWRVRRMVHPDLIHLRHRVCCMARGRRACACTRCACDMHMVCIARMLGIMLACHWPCRMNTMGAMQLGNVGRVIGSPLMDYPGQGLRRGVTADGLTARVFGLVRVVALHCVQPSGCVAACAGTWRSAKRGGNECTNH